MNVIDETLINFQRQRSDVDSNTGSYNIVDALVVAAFVGRIHLDCVYSLLRGEPDVLQKTITVIINNDSDNGYECIQ